MYFAKELGVCVLIIYVLSLKAWIFMSVIWNDNEVLKLEDGFDNC